MEKTKFRAAVLATQDVKGAYKVGLEAMGKYSSRVIVPDNSLLGGSIDIDESTKKIYPNDNRWDYAFEYNGETFFIEIHTASTSETSTVLHKLAWIKQWLREKAPKIDRLKSKTLGPFFWIQYKQYALPKHTPQYRAAAAAKLLPIKNFDYQKLMAEHIQQQEKGNNKKGNK